MMHINWEQKPTYLVCQFSQKKKKNEKIGKPNKWAYVQKARRNFTLWCCKKIWVEEVIVR